MIISAQLRKMASGKCYCHASDFSPVILFLRLLLKLKGVCVEQQDRELDSAMRSLPIPAILR